MACWEIAAVDNRCYNAKEKEIIYGIKQSLKEAKAGDTLPLDSLWNQL